MRRLLFLCILFVCCSATVCGQAGLSPQIDSLIKQLLPAGSEVGISVYDLTARKSVYTYRDARLSRPASTMKLLTAITALSRPDAQAPFRTEVWYNGVIEHDTLQGDLYIIGGFDPEFGEEGMNRLVEDVITLPFTVLKGTVYGDVSMKDSLYYGNGWMWDDIPYSYQPRLSPLMYEKGAIAVTALPAASQGDAARLITTPQSTYYTVSNQTKTRTPAAGKFNVTRNWLENGNTIIVTGDVQSSRKDGVSVSSSRDFFMYAFLEKLRAKGIEVTGGYAFSDFRKEKTSVQVSRWETPMQDVLNQLMKESDNLNAEALLCRIAAQATGKKHLSAEDGIVEVRKLISQLGHRPDDYGIADGCGLSNYDYISPALLVDFLKYAYSRTDVFQRLYKSLPVAGVDGTLKNRMKTGKAYKNVHAKTGSYTAINSLAGYLKTASGHELAFAIMNQNILSGAKARNFQDRVCELLCR